MNITLNDLIRMDSFRNIKVIAGKDGMCRPVESLGWLDYEFVKTLKNGYIHSNFNKWQLIMTSFLYAKDNAFLTRDAIRHLIEIDASGLIINNVFRLDIPEAILRYADAKDFPIFLVEKQPFDLCQLTITFHDYMCDLARADFGDKEIGALLNAPATKDEIRSSALRMNPSFYPQIVSIYLHKENALCEDEYVNKVVNYQKSPYYNHHNSLYRYQNGFMYIISSEDIELERQRIDYEGLIQTLIGEEIDYSIGVGNSHYNLNEIDQAMRESIYASVLNRRKDHRYTKYGDLGSYQAILPLADQPAMIDFSQKLLEPILEYDAANNTVLLSTLLKYVELDGNLHQLAKEMNQHENTLRYRFNQIERIVGLNPIRSGDYEQLALAAKIHICRSH